MPTPRAHRSPLDVTLASPCTWLRLRKLSRQLTNLYDQQLAPFGLTVTQFSLLAHLPALDGISVGGLAETLVMDPTALTRALRPLQRHGYVQLLACPQDKRARRVHLTDAGRKALEAARSGWRRAQQQVDGVLKARDITALNGLLDGLIEDMKADRSHPGAAPAKAKYAGKGKA